MSEKVVIERELVRPLIETGKRYYITVGILAVIVLWGVVAYLYQLSNGLGVTGMNTTIFWGVYLATFIFFIGISHAGTFISAILRVTHAEWRRPITRLSETITIFALILAVMQVILFDLGRPDRILHAILYARLQSPLTWDLFSIISYFTASALYLYVAMIPDLGILLAHGKPGRIRRALYTILSLDWKGTKEQYKMLENAIKIMAALVIPVMVTVHTVVSWALAMLVRPAWHSTVFGPYFVTGAIYSGIAAVITLAWIFEKVYKTGHIKVEHFRNLGYLLFALNLALIYMTVNHILVDYYGGEKAHITLLNALMFGEWAPIFWTYMFVDIIIPLIILAIVLFYKKEWLINGTFIVSLIVNIGMYLERYVLVAPTLSRPYLPYPFAIYIPTWVELSILAASIAAFLLLYMIFIKIFPPIPIWEVKKLDENLELLRKYSTVSTPAMTTRLNGGSKGRIRSRPSPLPRLLLMAIGAVYTYLLYVIIRFIVIPVYTPEGYIASNELFKIVTLPVIIGVTIAWFGMGYVVYLLHKMCKIGQ